jgi:hypothetical protein
MTELELHWFFPPVPVETDQLGIHCNVNSVEAASEHLLRWTKRGPQWAKAVRCCMAAMEDKATAQEVRRCFRLAAKEEGLLLDP